VEPEKESPRPAPGLDLRARPTGLAAAPLGTQHVFLDDLGEADLVGQGLRGFVQEDTPDVRRYIYNARVSSEFHTSTLV
jgi:hypothetical protein